MSIYRRNREFYERPFRLTQEQQQVPLEVITEIFHRIGLHEVREDLANLLEVAITSENDVFAEPRQRDNIIMFCQYVEELFEAAYILQKEKRNI